MSVVSKWDEKKACYEITGELSADGPVRLVPEGKGVAMSGASVQVSESGSLKFGFDISMFDPNVTQTDAVQPVINDPVQPTVPNDPGTGESSGS